MLPLLACLSTGGVKAAAAAARRSWQGVCVVERGRLGFLVLCSLTPVAALLTASLCSPPPGFQICCSPPSWLSPSLSLRLLCRLSRAPRGSKVLPCLALPCTSLSTFAKPCLVCVAPSPRHATHGSAPSPGLKASLGTHLSRSRGKKKRARR